MAADDLFGGVALDPFRVGAPTGDLSLRVQHEDGVVLNAVQQHPLFLLAFHKLSLGHPASCTLRQHGPECNDSHQYSQEGCKNQN